MRSTTLLALFAFAGISLATPFDSDMVAVHRRHKSVAHGRSPARRCSPRSDAKATAPKVAAVKINSNASAATTSASTGLIAVSVPRCGETGATKEVTQTTGPNGSIDFINCGLEEKGGWQPPRITIKDLKTVDLQDAIDQPGSPFKACKSFVDKIQKHAEDNGIPAIVIASIAMQESNCNPKTIGGAGEVGVMQLTKEKCKGADDCLDLDFNIGKGASYLKGLLDKNDGDFLLSLGAYNGWEEHMTEKDAKKQYGGNCRTQRNLDYLFQNLNVWYQNKNAYGKTKYGKYFNLDKCSNQD